MTDEPVGDQKAFRSLISNTSFATRRHLLKVSLRRERPKGMFGEC